jgi:hypothetical protein
MRSMFLLSVLAEKENKLSNIQVLVIFMGEFYSLHDLNADSNRSPSQKLHDLNADSN